MNQGTESNVWDPVDNSEVLKFGAVEDARSILVRIVRDGARKMLQAALEDEGTLFLEAHSSKVDESGRRNVIRNGYMPLREVITGPGSFELTQPRVRDKSSAPDRLAKFPTSILPPYLRRSKAIDEFVPWLYLKGVSTGDFSDALQSITGGPVAGLSANTIKRRSFRNTRCGRKRMSSSRRSFNGSRRNTRSWPR